MGREKEPRPSLFGEAVREAYRRGEEEEGMNPLVRVNAAGDPVGSIRGGDYVIFYDIRGEREIELTETLTNAEFSQFPLKSGVIANFATMIEYSPGLKARVAFPPQGAIEDTLSEVVSRAGLRQAKVVETEKAVHLGFFLNGKHEDPFPHEERVFIESAKVERYDENPEMRAKDVAAAVIERISDSEIPLIIANFANTDVVGHTLNEEAIFEAIRTVDGFAGRVVEAARRNEICVLLTADHGTVEKRLYPDGKIDTGHTDSPVPLIFMDFRPGAPRDVVLPPGGSLTDVAPTALRILGLPKPVAMTGRDLIPAGYPSLSPNPRVLLLIVDGWGYQSETHGNLIAQAATPNMDRLWADFPHSVLDAAGEAVGLPSGTVGNSESGHLHIGAGRVIPADRVRIAQAIESGVFFQNEAFLWAIRSARQEGRPLHLLGIVSFFSSHGSLQYLYALLELAKRESLSEVYIHGLLGRRGERPESGAWYVDEIAQKTREIGVGKIATIMGRHWALDREENWDRIEKAYRALVEGTGVPVREESGAET
jgi:2,3-bisphosphoglycerate-independent phosphoglycerate mutase